MISRGVAFMIASAAAFSAMAVLVKLTSRALPVGEVVLARALVTLALSWWAVRALPRPWGQRRGRLALRGLLGFCGLTCYYVALSRLPLAEATTLHFMTPLLTAVFAWRLLGERVGWPTAAALALGLAGVVAISQPARLLTGAGLDPLGVAAALAGAALSALAYVTVRSLAASEPPAVIVFYFPLVAAPLSAPWALADFVWPSPGQALLLLGIGVTTQAGQVFLTRGLTLERAATATAVGYVQVAFAFAWGLLLFHEPLRHSTALGVVLIGAAVVTIALAAARRTADAAPR
ncbi:MAG: DMT family transporter [Kofleriaceae bacterium]